MNETFELRMDFKKVDKIPGTSVHRCSPEIEKIKHFLSTMDIGGIYHVPLKDMYSEYPEERLKAICNQYTTKIHTAIRHLKKTGLYKFRVAKRLRDLYVERIE